MRRFLIAMVGAALVGAFLFPTAALAKNPKVDVCHAEGNGSYHLINISEKAAAKYIANHGDGFPGDPVPGMEEFLFGEDCDPVPFCQDPLGCVSYAAEDPIRLATALVMSGPLSFLGFAQVWGTEIALDMRGPVLGHAVELSTEDTMCGSVGGGEAAANAIVADPTIAAVVGTSCSSVAAVAAPIISDAGYSMVSPSTNSPVLTDPDTHADGFLRVSWNDRDEAVAMAEYVSNNAATTSAVVVAVFDTFSATLGEDFVETFEAMGGTNLAFEEAEGDGSDADDVIDALLLGGVPDVLYLPVFTYPGISLVEAARAEPLLDGTQLAGSASYIGVEAILLEDELEDDAEGMLLTSTDLSFTSTPEYAAFAVAYFDAHAAEPLTPFSALAFDATNVILAAIEEVGVVDGVGTLHIGRQALRDALFATAGLQGLTGSITCDPLGECGAIGFEVFEVVGGVLQPAS